jgi:pimeloyl-ACP methyl ester carboxylesterase
VTDAFTPEHRGGNGSPLVCLHGLVDTWRSWELVLPELDGVGHCPQLDVPLETAQLILGFTA